MKKTKIKTEKKGRDRILIIDGQNWCHRAFHAQSNLRFGEKKIGLVWGFINMLQSTLTRFPKPKRVYVCFDHGRNQHRLDTWPEYKNRPKKIDFDRESFEEQIHALRKILVYMGIPVLYAKMTEADDFIAQLTVKYRKKYKIVIASGDKDFRQLVSPKVSIIDDKHGRITTKNFKSMFQIEPHQYADFLMMWGDTSDHIPGVTGVGEVTAIKILQQWQSMSNYNLSAPDSLKKSESIEIYERNKTLINLEYFLEKFGPQPLIFYRDKAKPKFNEEKYLKMCKLWGLKKFGSHEFIKTYRHSIGK